jgi:hypothetical protein
MDSATAPAAPKPERDPLHSLMQAWENNLLRERKQERGSEPYRPANVYASKYRRCTRAMALDMLHPEDDPFDQAIQFERMKQGNEAEDAVAARLAQIGPFCDPPFSVIEQQRRFEVRDRDRTVVITGKMDGRLRFGDGGPRPPFEIKSGKTYEGCETIDDFSRNPWAGAAIDQLLAYLYADDPKNHPGGNPWGFILIRRQSKLPVFVRVGLMDNLDRVERFMTEARRAVDARHGRGPLPDVIQDPGECRRCPHFGKSCDPPLDYGKGLSVIAEPEAIVAAETRHRTRAAHEEYEAADKYLKERFRGIEAGIVGDFLLAGKWSPLTTYDVPKDVKEQYRQVNPHGRFTLSIERIAS